MKFPLRFLLGGFLVLSLSIGLIGCKEEDDTTINSNPPVSDTTPPTVLSTSPSEASPDTLADTSISVTFSESIKLETVTSNTEDLICTGSLQVSLDDFSSCVQMNSDPTTDTDQEVFTIYPSSTLEYETIYKIKVTSDIEDLSGNTLEEEYVQDMGFTTVSDTTSDSTTEYGFTIGSISGNTTELGGTATFTIKLNSQPSDDVTITISSSDETEGTVSPSSLTFTSDSWNGEQNVTVTGVDDSEADGDQNYSIILGEANSSDSRYNGLNPNDVTVTNTNDEIPRLPDTGQITSYTAIFGEDNDYSINPQSFTDNGNETITDNNTNLMWQKEDDNTTRTWDAAGTYCTNSTLAGYPDWRLPNRKELNSIVDHEIGNPSINQTFFPNTNSSGYWSSTTDAFNTGDASSAWIVDFSGSTVLNRIKGDTYYVRCVRGGSESDIWSLDFSFIGDDVISHGSTNLMWQKEDDNTERNWESALTYCEALDLGGYNDWRLPNINELQTIVDYMAYGPAINQTYFPNTNSSNYWSSTTSAGHTYDAWYVEFYYSYVIQEDKSNNKYVRCVRGGQ